MPIDKRQAKLYKAIGHKLQPVATIAGKGLSESVVNEVNRALNDHELIKVRLNIPDREMRKQTISELSEITQSQIIQEIGRTALLFKASDKPNPKLSNLLRH